jgi:hypothetical protein
MICLIGYNYSLILIKLPSMFLHGLLYTQITPFVLSIFLLNFFFFLGENCFYIFVSILCLSCLIIFLFRKENKKFNRQSNNYLLTTLVLP